MTCLKKVNVWFDTLPNNLRFLVFIAFWTPICCSLAISYWNGMLLMATVGFVRLFYLRGWI